MTLRKREWFKYPFRNIRIQFSVALFVGMIALFNIILFSYLFFLFSQKSIFHIIEWLPDHAITNDFIQEQFGYWIQTIFMMGLIEIIGVVIFALFYSHRIAGPLYALRIRYQSLREGKIPEPVYSRKSDLLKEPLEEFNRVIETFKQREETFQKELSQLERDVEAKRLDEAKARLQTISTHFLFHKER